MDSTCVIGLGNPELGDDGAGPTVAALVAGVASLRGEAFDLLDLWDGCDRVVVVATMRSGRAPGTVLRFDATAAPLPPVFGAGGTRMGLTDVVELARLLGRLPGQLTVIGIEGSVWDVGRGLGPEVTAAVASIAGALRTFAPEGPDAR